MLNALFKTDDDSASLILRVMLGVVFFPHGAQKVLALGGRIAVIGSRGTVEIDPRDTMGRNGSILGMVLFNATEAETRCMHAALGAGLENGTLRPIVGRELPLVEAAAAHRAVLEPGAYGKIVLVP